MKRKKRKLKRVWLCILIILIVSTALYFVLFKKVINKTSVLESNKKYGYTLEMRDSALMKENYHLLIDELKNDKIDYEKYAEYLSKLFVIDLFTMDNKNSKFDVGSTEYVYEEKLDSFKSKVEDTLYKYIGLMDELPCVSSIELKEINEDTYEYNDKKYDAYKVVLEWEYEEDLTYPTEAELVIANIDDKLYVVEFSEVEA